MLEEEQMAKQEFAEEDKKDHENDLAKNATIMLCNILYDNKVKNASDPIELTLLCKKGSSGKKSQANNPNRWMKRQRDFSKDDLIIGLKQEPENSSDQIEQKDKKSENNNESKDLDFVEEEDDFQKFIQKDLVFFLYFTKN